MKRFLILITFLFCSSTLFSQGIWEKINSPTSNFLRKLHFSDNLNGWACGLNGTIIKTSDGGNNWDSLNTMTNNPIIDVFFVDEHFGWALEWEFNSPPFGTHILKTSNGGQDWQSSFYPVENKFMNAVFFADSLNGWLGGPEIVYTTNGGATWEISFRDSNQISTLPVLDIQMMNKNYGFACGGFIDVAGVAWKTTDGGRNWSSAGISADQIFDFYILDSLNVVALSGDPEYLYGVAVIRTTDGGINWTYNELPIYAVSFGISFRNQTEGLSVAGFKLLYTDDGGFSWGEQNSPDSSVFYDIQFIDSTTAIACGQDGVIYKYSIPQDTQKVIHSNVVMFNPYPNPFSSSIKIGFAVPGSEQSLIPIQIKLFDVLGKELCVLVNKSFSTGEYQILFNPKDHNINMASGVYLCALSSNDLVFTKKIIYLK